MLGNQIKGRISILGDSDKFIASDSVLSMGITMLLTRDSVVSNFVVTGLDSPTNSSASCTLRDPYMLI